MSDHEANSAYRRAYDLAMSLKSGRQKLSTRANVVIMLGMVAAGGLDTSDQAVRDGVDDAIRGREPRLS